MKIIKRKNYYYLAFNFRLEKKVVHREKYLGKDVPESIEAIKEKFMRECLEEWIFARILKIKKGFGAEWKKYPESYKRKFLIGLSVSFTYNTNAIEGSTITLKETEELIMEHISPNRPLRDVQETINHSKVFLEVFNEKRQLSNEMLLEWHKEVFNDSKPDIAGVFREYNVRIGNYRAPDWQDVKNLMKELVDFYRKNSLMNPAELAARMHYKFEKIHPFGDGNGRIGRLLILYILKKGHYPILVIEKKKRKAYYNAISKTEHDFMLYFFRAYFKAHKEYLVEKA